MRNSKDYRKREEDYVTKELGCLVGGEIVQLAVSPDDGEFGTGENYYGFVVKCPDGRTRSVLFSRDQEGNGPGWYEIRVLA